MDTKKKLCLSGNRRIVDAAFSFSSSSSSVWNIVVVMIVLVTMATSMTLVTESPPGERTEKAGDEPWLADGSVYDVDSLGDAFRFQFQADGGQPIDTEQLLCPRVPKELTPGGCDLEECRSDRECVPKGLMCCYNGCVYTCLQQVPSDAYIDWLREPKRLSEFGNSWLIQGSEPEQNFIPCSTTQPDDDDSDPLLCPHGYDCVIDTPAVPSDGIPNSGHCAQTQTPEDSFENPMLSKEGSESEPDIPKMDSKHDCELEDGLLLISGQTTTVNGEKCVCIEQELKCEETDSDEIEKSVEDY